ncbi:tetratricopeptide repeat protein [Labilithrix luteola]|uniref:tetratricopeptide repeat protein n=1 Tax=Labilithrix luteola TaxID=1391654 RepID=UPI001F0B2C00|nr:tetratricopeptide repeat protein [Labilithrix luteola]
MLDKEANGALTETERARLDAHVEGCTTCAFERQLRADFREETDGDLVIGRHTAQELVALALQGSATRATRATRATEEAPATRPGPRRRTWMLLAAAAVLAVSAAAADESLGGALRRAVGLDVPTVEVTPRSPEATPSTPAPSPRLVHATTASSVTVVEAAEPAEDVASPVPTSPVPTPAVTPPKSVAVRTASTYFDEANEARRRGDYARALALCSELQARYPSSREAHVSYATAGRLELDRGNLGAALASFDAYDAHGQGELDEAVMVGRATALERLGRIDEARRAWSRLLTAFPSTPYADHARTQIGTETTLR